SPAMKNTTNLKLLFLLLGSLLHFESFAQKEANNWFFGGGVGINFNYNPPQSLQGGMSLNHNGHASISDANGILQFYTGDNSSGYGLWNRNHQPLLNSDFMHSIGTSNNIIIPWPGQPQKYYLFHSNMASPPSCESYSVVDMALNNSLGGVTSIKNACHTNLTGSNKMGVQHRNNRDYCLI